MSIPVMKLADFHAALRAQGVMIEHAAVKCPVCGTVQSFADLQEAHAAATPELLRARFGSHADPQTNFAHSCVGRYRGAGSWQPGTAPGSGCDWTLGGFFHAHRLLIELPDGEQVPAFEPATPQEARDHFANRKGATA
jgi:hypothetical protein